MVFPGEEPGKNIEDPHLDLFLDWAPELDEDNTRSSSFLPRSCRILQKTFQVSAQVQANILQVLTKRSFSSSRILQVPAKILQIRPCPSDPCKDLLGSFRDALGP